MRIKNHMKRAYGVLALVLVLVVGFRVVNLMIGQGDDAAMIKETLRQSLEASRKGEPGGVLEAISSSIKVNDQEQGGQQSFIANYIKSQKPDIEVTNQTPIVTGDEARITSPVRLKISVPIVGDKTVVAKDVVMVFHKETAREFLIFPVKKWRLAEIQAPPMALDMLNIE